MFNAKSLIFIICISLLSLLKVNSQDFTIGVRGGLNYYTIGDINSRGGSLPNRPPDELFSPENELGTQFGAFLDVEFGKFLIRPEINFSSSKNRYDFPVKEAYWKTSRIDVPILVGYEIFDPITIYVGPGFNVFNDFELDGVQVTSFSDGGPDHKKSALHFNFGIMVRSGRFGVDLRYEMNSKETEEELLDIVRSAYGVNLADLKPYKPNVISLSISIEIFRTNDEDVGGFFNNLFKNNKCYCPY